MLMWVDSFFLFHYILSINFFILQVDDFECDRFIEAVKMNSSLKELVLSRNKIGQAENLNTVYPDLTTGIKDVVLSFRHN